MPLASLTPTLSQREREQIEPNTISVHQVTMVRIDR